MHNIHSVGSLNSWKELMAWEGISSTSKLRKMIQGQKAHINIYFL